MSAANGGPAFPVDQIVERDEKGRMHGHEISSAGISVRDYFAGKALCGYLASVNQDFEPAEYATTIARDCYILADAMLMARKGGAS